MTSPPLGSLLRFAGTEAQMVASLFPEAATSLVEHAATKAAVWKELERASRSHWACHGFFDPSDPLSSGLVLGDGVLSVREILATDLMRRCELMVLSACQTGMSDFQKLPDEAIGLPAALLQAGVQAVVATLWPVDDLATSLLMIRFYESARSHDAQRVSALRALAAAQCWVRDASAKELIEYLEERSVIPASFVQAVRKRIDGHRESETPFSNPYYWAPFISVGVPPGPRSAGKTASSPPRALKVLGQ